MTTTPSSLAETQPSKPVSPTHTPRETVIKVLGLGGGGCNAIDRMIQLGITGVDFIAANTDAQALQKSESPKRILLGSRVTRGLGAGGDPSQGETAAVESREYLAEALRGADMIFLACGMGGGTGTGSIPIAAEIARETGAVTIAVVTTPFAFEGARRHNNAQDGLARLRKYCDTLITVPNDRLLKIVPRTVSLDVAFRMADDVLRQGIQGIAELITRPGLINVDFAHVRSLMQLAGGALLAVGQGKGSNKAMDAMERAMNHPLLDTAAIDQAAGILVHFTGGDDLTLFEVGQAVSRVTQAANPDAEVIFGATVDSTLEGRAQVIMVATGVGGHTLEEVMADTQEQEREPVPLAAEARARRPAPQLEIAPATGPEPATPELEPLPQPQATMLNPDDRDPRHMEWVVAEPVPVVPADIDIPAFLRRRRLFGGKPEQAQKAGL